MIEILGPDNQPVQFEDGTDDATTPHRANSPLRGTKALEK